METTTVEMVYWFAVATGILAAMGLSIAFMVKFVGSVKQKKKGKRPTTTYRIEKWK